MRFVERHRKIVLRRDGPARQDRSLFDIHYFDFLLVRHVHEKTSSFLLQAKRFGMGIYDNVASLFPAGVNESEPSGSLFSFSQLLSSGVSDDHALATRVIANVVGVVRELHFA